MNYKLFWKNIILVAALLGVCMTSRSAFAAAGSEIWINLDPNYNNARSMRYHAPIPMSDDERTARLVLRNQPIRDKLFSFIKKEEIDYYIVKDELWQNFINSEVLQEYFQDIDEHGNLSEKMLIKMEDNSTILSNELSKIVDNVRPLYQKRLSTELQFLVRSLEGKDLHEFDRQRKKARIQHYMGDPHKAKNLDAVHPVALPDNYTTHGMMASSQTNASVIESRVSEIDTMSGFATGDEVIKFGAWLKGTFSKGQQKSYSMEPGYKFNQAGFTVGADSYLGSSGKLMLGAAVSILNNNIKSPDSDNTDEKISSYIGNIYGIVSFDQAYITGGLQFGKSDINKDRHSGDNDDHVAKGKTKGDIYGARAEAGYNYQIPAIKSIITPSIGVVYNAVSAKGYKETGLGLNRKIDARDSSRTDAIIGLSAKFCINMKELKILPEIFAISYQNLKSRNDNTKIYLVDDMDPIITPGQKLSKDSYKLGGALNLLSGDSFEIRFGYDRGIGKRFNSHAGSVKLRIDF